MISNTDINKAIVKSQHCQRNWDLSKEIPTEDMEVLVTAATQCPSKQNIAHYKAHFITNRDLIEKIHSMTDGFMYSYAPKKTTTNSQTLANLLVVLEGIPTENKLADPNRNLQVREIATGDDSENTNALMMKDSYMAVGVAAGYLNVSATIMGYSTGCCACFDTKSVRELLGLEHNPILMMGIGYKNAKKNRRIHHKNDEFKFPTLKKQPIQTKYYA